MAEQTTGRPLVITHADCPDGWCCEWLFRRHFGGRADYMSAKYGDPPPDVTGRPYVYIADFSYKRPAMLHLIQQARGMVSIIDHHTTAERDLAGIEDELYVDTLIGMPRVVFDMAHSGAHLTWKYLHGIGLTDPIFDHDNPPLIVQYVEDRDLWRWALPGSKEINAALGSYPLVKEVWDGLYEQLLTEDGYWPLFREGAAILRAQNQAVESAVRQAVEMTIAGHRVLVVNTTCHRSEIGERLAEGRAFGATYFDDLKRGLRIWSFRSRDGGIDVSEVAKRFGGGGHRPSAGCQRPLLEPMSLMEKA